MYAVTEEVLTGGRLNAGAVVRVGDTVRRPRNAGHEAVEAMLGHLETVGFDGAPRFLGIDEQGRQILDYLDGDTWVSPSWQQEDDRNAEAVGQLARWLRGLHDATAGFEPPEGAMPQRSRPIEGSAWTHGDVGYPNVIYGHGRIVGLIDWEFAAPAHRCCDLAALLATAVRAPRHDADDNARRTRAVMLAVDAIASGYGLTDAEIEALPTMAATLVDDLVSFNRRSLDEADVYGWEWRAAWFRNDAPALLSR